MKGDLIKPTFLFGVYMPSEGSIEWYKEVLSVLEELCSYYDNYGNIIIAGDFNASCITGYIHYTNK